jgi:hypothetical protein
MTFSGDFGQTQQQRDRQNFMRPSVITDPETSSTIYNGELKMILPAVDLPSLKEICRLSSKIAIYVCERGGRRGSFEIYRADAQRGATRIPLNHPPTFCLAMLAMSSGGKRVLEALREAWSIGAEGFLPNSTFIDHADGRDVAAAATHRALFDSIANAYGSSAARLLALQRQYTSFRIVHDQLQNAFDTVENFLTRSQLPATWLAFACEPTEAALGPLSANAPFRLTQLLPLPSQGLAAIELHATPAGADGEGSLTVSVATCEEDRILGEWSIPYAMVPDGWMFLDLPEIDISPRQSVVLTAAWVTKSGTPPRFSLTVLQPVHEARVSVPGNERIERSLALRLHLGLPGSRRVAHPWQIGVRHQPHPSRLGRQLAPSVLRGVTELDPTPGHEPLVTFVEDPFAIEVRPMNGSMTVAKLPCALPAGACQLTATIKTEDPAGPLVEYALLALSERGAYRQVLTKGRLNGAHGGFSGWQVVHPDFATQIHLSLSARSQTPLDLYLATRLAEGQAAICVQARWLEFVVDAFPEASSQ